jgi:hypothetical protein
MGIQKVTNSLIYCLSSDTKPTGYPDNSILIETDTGDRYRYVSAVWTKISGSSLAETLTNKTMDANTAPIYGVMSSFINSPKRRFGFMHGNQSSLYSWGTFAGVASTAGTIGGAQTYSQSEPNFPYPISTLATSATLGKLQWPLQTRWADGPRVRIKFKLSTTTAIRFFIGWTTNASFPASDTFLANADSGMGIGKISSSSNLTIYRNDGTGAMLTQSLSPAPTDTDMTSIVTYEMWVDTTANTFNFSHDGRTTIQSFSRAGSIYPADNTLLSFIISVGTSANAIKTLTMYATDGENT